MEEEVINTLFLIYHYSIPEDEKYLFQAIKNIYLLSIYYESSI